MKSKPDKERPTNEMGPDVEGFIVPIDKRSDGIGEGVIKAIVSFTIRNSSPRLDVLFFVEDSNSHSSHGEKERGGERGEEGGVRGGEEFSV